MNGLSSSVPRPLTRCFNMAALHAQAIFCDEGNVGTSALRYGCATALDARRVAQDLLDISLMTESSPAARSLGAEFAALLKLPIESPDVSIARSRKRGMPIRHTETLAARILALAIVDNLMSASVPTNAAARIPTYSDGASLRTHWLWPLISQASLNLLIERTKYWPAAYIRNCWPELEDLVKYPMVQRKTILIRRRARISNRRTDGSGLANIRSN
jgi:hypothetical protein